MSKLIGTNPNQVPSNADLGSAAFVEAKQLLDKNNAKLDAVESIINETATNVFVYDTRTDADGGAWRKQTKHTSWYNEELNTETRGSRREFPQVAVIITYGTGFDITCNIHDADDPNLPMWMVFKTIPSSNMWFYNSPFSYSASTTVMTSIAMKEGLMVGGQTPFGLKLVDFIRDVGEFRELGYYRHIQDIISHRNIHPNRTNQPLPQMPSGDMPADDVQGVSMITLPNASKDYRDGAAVMPTIVVSTGGGIGIIREDGTVITGTSTSGSAYNYSNQNTITKDGYIWYTADSFANVANGGLRDSYAIPITSLGKNFQWDNGTDNISNVEGYSVSTDDENGDIQYGAANVHRLKIIEDYAIGTDWSLGLVELNKENPSYSLTAEIGNTYNSGWMCSQSVMATLNSCRRTDRLNIDLNGTFTGSSGSPGNYGTLYINEESLYRVELTGYGNVDGSWPNGSPIDGVYHRYQSEQFTLNIHDTGASTTPITSTVDVIGFPYWTFHTWNTHTMTSYQIREHEASRGINQTACIITGTPVKRPVAEGAELMGYGNWSANTYIRRNAVTLGSDYSVMFWFKPETNQGMIFHTAQGTRVEFSSGEFRFTAYDGSQTLDVRDGTYNLNDWHHAVCRKYGDHADIFINGKLVDTDFRRGFGTLDGDGSMMTIGNRSDAASEPFLGQLSLFRVATSIPNEKQIQYMYETERKMFMPNSKCTIYGTSHNVTALASDREEKKLHVGTNQGRSVFEGLVRTDNTTEGVTMISASNGMVVEE